MSNFEIPMNLQMFAEGAEGPDVAEPVNMEPEPTNTDPESVVAGEGLDNSDGPEDQGQARDYQHDADFAAARRRAEQQYQAQIAARDAEYARRFGHLTNPVTGQPIRSERDYFAALDAQQRAAQQQKLRDQGIDPALIDQAVNNSPVMQQAQQVLRQARLDEGNRQLDEQLREISSFYPEVKNLRDIQKMDTFPAFDQYVRSGMSLTDAFRLANFDALVGRGNAAAKQAAINSARSKQHLSPVGGVAGSAGSLVEIPANERSLWEDAYPGLPYKELREKYNRTL